MSALAELERVGLRARLVDGRLQVGPPDRLTPEARALVARLAAAIATELTRYRAWRVRMTDGKTMTVMCPAGMTQAEALAAVDRWPGSTVEPLQASRVD